MNMNLIVYKNFSMNMSADIDTDMNIDTDMDTGHKLSGL